jgi:hypothetical protein
MNESMQKRQIQRFLKGHDKRDIDAFCIYQWIERCHTQEWWELAIELSPHIAPGALKTDYQKRLDFILKECRIKQDVLIKQRIDGQVKHPIRPDRHPIRKIIRKPDLHPGAHLPGEELYFDNRAKKTLRQIYSVLYYMQRNCDFADAVRRTKDNLNIAYQTVDDKCARRFAGTVEIFQKWYQNGEILERLRNHFELSFDDYKIFEKLLINTSIQDL